MRTLYTTFLTIIAIFFQIVPASAQIDMDLMKGMEPRNIGPAGMSGRVTAIDVIDDRPDNIYIGSASGGVWKSESGGVDWEPVFENEKYHAIGALHIYQKNPSVIWVGTGEGNPRNSQSSGGGVYKSIDGGKTWEFMGLEKTRVIHRIIVHPDNPDIVYVGAQGDAWSDSEHRGLYKSTDGGETWEKILYNNERTGIADLVIDPRNPNKMFAAMWEFRRWPWFFESGGEGSGLYMTLDGGENWKEITHEDGLPKGKLGRMGIAIARSNPDMVYAFVESNKNAIYRSEDGGYTWERRVKVEDDPQAGNRPFYYAEIYVDPKNENRVYSLYSFLSVSEDGAKSFESIYPYYNYIHPDHHAFYIHPDDPSFIIDGNDGGMNISHDRGKTWRFVTNLPLAQYYHINVDNQIPYNVYGGMQDNGSWQGPAYVWRQGGIRNSYFEELYFGDGFDVVIDSSNARYGYAMSQRGNVGRVDLVTHDASFVRPVHPDGTELRFNWNAAIALDPHDDKTVYFGSQFVHKSNNRGESWEVISPDLTTDDPEKQRQHESGGLTIDATGAENFTTITAIDPSPLNTELLWVGTDDGNIQITRDDGENWKNVAGNLKDVPKGSWVTQVHASQYNEGEAVAVINNYRRGDWSPYLMHTTNYGKKWRNLAAEEGIEGYALSFVQDHKEPNLMFLGTELGLYVSIDGGEKWTEWEPGYPTASTYDMAIQKRENDLVIGTFGRSAWVLDDIRPLRELAKKGTGELNKTVNVYPAPDAYLAEIRQAAGTRFAGDAIFSGDNRPFGARLTYSVAEIESEDDGEGQEEKESSDKSNGEDAKKDKKDDKVIVEIFNQQDEKIRTLEEKPEHKGINRMTWGLNEKGVRGPSREAPPEDAQEPTGPEVLPGTYKVKMTYRGASDSTMVTVHSDPRIEIDQTEMREKYRMLKEIMELRETTGKAVSNLRDANDMVSTTMELIKANKNGGDDAMKELRERSKAVKDSVSALMDMVFGPEDERQGITREPDPTVTTYLFRPYRYLNTYIGDVDQTERVTLQQAEEAVNNAVSKINEFFESEWQQYVDDVEAAELSPFKEIEPVEMDD